MQFQASDSLRSRTYLGLILAQFLAAFNDQTIHIVAIFYAGDLLVHYLALPHVNEQLVISIVTACFISPFFFFSTLAGMLADKYSKRSILVFWKLAEVSMMALAFVGFLLPHLAGTGLASTQSLTLWSALLVVSVVFLMGTHSAFFVPAKYGVMPEILMPTQLSRGNGYLEATSFVAQIAGTACGGFLYGILKSQVSGPPTAKVFEPGREWMIGLLLLVLAVIGAIGSLLMDWMPPAAPDKPLTWKLWRPLKANVGVLLRSKPLALAVLGIAFFTFMTLFLRQTLLYDGEVGKDLQQARQWQAAEQKRVVLPEDDEGTREPDVLPSDLKANQRAELKVALLIALVGLGIGIGSPLAGRLSGNKVELGLVPIGASFLMLFTTLMALLKWWAAEDKGSQFWSLVVLLVLVGVAASFYIVPLYTLLQHRAPKDSKGNLVATSNFINVAGGLVAVAVFYLVTIVLERVLGLQLTEDVVQQDLPRLLPVYIAQLQMKMRLPSALFLAASLFTLGIVILLCRQLPDFFVRSLLWLRSHGRWRLKVVGLHNLPSDGPVILATNCDRFDSCMQVVTATDRFTRFILLESPDDESPRPLLRYLARRTGLVALHPGRSSQEMWDKALAKAARTLGEGNLLGVTADGDRPVSGMEKFLDDLRALTPAPILPVYCGTLEPTAEEHPTLVHRVQVVMGHPLRPDATSEEIRRAIHVLGEWMHQTDRAGLMPATVMIPGGAAASPTRPAADHPAHP